MTRRPARSLPLWPPSPEPTRRNPAVVAAAIIAAGTVVTGVVSFVEPVVAADRTPSERTCAVVAGEVRETTGGGRSTTDVRAAPRDRRSTSDGGTATSCVVRRT